MRIQLIYQFYLNFIPILFDFFSLFVRLSLEGGTLAKAGIQIKPEIFKPDQYILFVQPSSRRRNSRASGNLQKKLQNSNRFKIKKYFFIFIVFSNFAFTESFPIVTDNKDLLESIKAQFANRSLSNSSLQKFLSDNSYYSAELRREKGKTVIKNPYKIIFIFKGNKIFTEQELRKLIEIDENKIGSFFYNFAEKPIKQAYQEIGFLNMKIEKKEERKGWKKWIFLNISEGPRIRIGGLKVKGLLSRPSSYYEKFIINNSAKLIESGIYNKKDLKKGYENLINRLKSEGYLQSKIYSDRVFFKDSKAFITVNLEEGPLTLIRDIQIKNVKSVPVWEILSHIESRIQSALKIPAVQKDLKHIEDLYKSKGYMQVKITNKDSIIKYTPAGRYADLVIEIDEGPKAFVSKIAFIGLKEVKPDLINSLLKFKAGDVLTPSKKEKSLQALSETGLFSNISLNEHIKDNKFEVIGVFTERKKRTLRGGLGFNSQRGLTTQTWTELTHRNLFGWGRALAARGNGQINLTQNGPFFGYEFSGRYKEVFIPRYAYQGNINLSHSKNLFKYSENNINFFKKTQLSFFIDKNISESLKLKWNVLSFESKKEFCTNQNCPENPQQIASTNVKFSWDKRNNIFDPSKGYLLSWLTEWADPFLGSDKNIAFIKTDINSYFYWSFLENYTFGFVLKGGMISTIQNRQYIPVDRAFILGGYTSLRGYDGHIEGERLPRKKYAPIESANTALQLKKTKKENVINSQYGLVKINFRFPIFKSFKGLLFYDLGVVSLESASQQLWDYGHSAGLGFRYQTFLIPIGLDIAHQLSPKSCIKSEDNSCSHFRFHLSIGW